jgi:hypothetical protein
MKFPVEINGIDLNQEFDRIEATIKDELDEILDDRPLDSISENIATELDEFSKKVFSDTNLLSVAVLYNDIFDIKFSKNAGHKPEGWYN